MDNTPTPAEEVNHLVSEQAFREKIEEWNGSIDDWQRSTERECYNILSRPYEAERTRLTKELIEERKKSARMREDLKLVIIHTGRPSMSGPHSVDHANEILDAIYRISSNALNP